MNIFVPHCSGMLTDHLPHGDGLVAYGFISRLAERGHSVYVAAERIELSGPIPSNLHLFLIEPRGVARGFQRIDYMLQVRSLFRRLSSEVNMEIIHQLNPVYTGVSLALYDAKCPVVLGPYVGAWPKDPHAISVAHPALKSILHWSKNVLARLQQTRADALLLTTMAACGRISAGRARSKSTFILPHGIDSDLFSPGPPAGNSASGTESSVILFLANVSERKGIFDLLKAFESLAPGFPEARLWIVGDGEGLPAAQAAASQLASRSQISFLGRRSRFQTVELFRQAAIYCLPSHGEPFGMTVAEAMSCGRPVVVTDAGGPGCLVDDEGGMRVPIGRPDELASALCKLLVDTDRRAAMGLHNRSKVLTSMTWHRVIDRLEQIYATVLGIRDERVSALVDDAASCGLEVYLKGQNS